MLTKDEEQLEHTDIAGENEQLYKHFKNCQFLTELNINLPYNPGIALLDFYFT